MFLAGSAVFAAKDSGPSQVSADCAGAVTGQAVVRALRAAGCSQVLRLIATSTGTGGPCPEPIDIFNLSSGAAAYQAARAFGEESGNARRTVAIPPDNLAVRLRRLRIQFESHQAPQGSFTYCSPERCMTDAPVGHATADVVT